MTGRRGGLGAIGALALALALGLGAGLGGCGGGRDSSAPMAGREDDYLRRAEASEQEGDLAAAHAAYRDAARRYPTSAWTWAGVGRTARELGRFQEAEDAFTTAVRWDSTLVAERAAIAELALARGDFPEAAMRAAEALRHGGENLAWLALRGEALARAGRLTEARHAVDRALAIDAQDASVRIARAACLAAADSTDIALAELNSLVLSAPEDPRGWSARAHLRRARGDAAGAREDQERAVREGGDALARLQLAQWQLADGLTDRALVHFQALLEGNPRLPEALAGVGSCALALGDPEAAERAFDDAIASDPEFAPAYLALGRFRQLDGRLDEAVALFRKARARASLQEELWAECSVALADAYFALGEPQHALDVADALLARTPESAEARAIRGRALAAGAEGAASGSALEQIATRPLATRDELLAYAGWLLEHGDAERALRFAEQVLETHPADRDARITRAGARGALGQAEEAEAELHDLLAAGPPDAAIHRGLARLYLVLGRLPDAMFHAGEGEKLDPGDPDFSVIRGLAAMQRGETAEARAAFERERDLRPDSPKAWMNLGQLEFDSGRPEAAAECFARARDLDPGGWAAPFQLGLALAESGRTDEAVEAYREALYRNDRIAEAHNNLAWLLADRDLDPALAEVHARRAAELAPDNANVLGTLGWVQYKNRLFDEAAVSLKRARNLAPDDPMKHYMLGRVHAERGETGPARDEFREALRLDPAFARSESARRRLARLEE